MKYDFYMEFIKSTLRLVDKDSLSGDFDTEGFHQGQLSALAIICEELTGNKGKYDVMNNKFYISGKEVVL